MATCTTIGGINGPRSPLRYNECRAGFSTGIQLIELTGIAGDYNQNGTVDAADYTLWRENQNTTNTLPNDPLGTPQYNQWRAHFGQTSGSAATVVAIPESGIVLQILIAVGGTFSFVRFSKKRVE